MARSILERIAAVKNSDEYRGLSDEDKADVDSSLREKVIQENNAAGKIRINSAGQVTPNPKILKPGSDDVNPWTERLSPVFAPIQELVGLNAPERVQAPPIEEPTPIERPDAPPSLFKNSQLTPNAEADFPIAPSGIAFAKDQLSPNEIPVARKELWKPANEPSLASAGSLEDARIKAQPTINAPSVQKEIWGPVRGPSLGDEASLKDARKPVQGLDEQTLIDAMVEHRRKNQFNAAAQPDPNAPKTGTRTEAIRNYVDKNMAPGAEGLFPLQAPVMDFDIKNPDPTIAQTIFQRPTPQFFPKRKDSTTGYEVARTLENAARGVAPITAMIAYPPSIVPIMGKDFVGSAMNIKDASDKGEDVGKVAWQEAKNNLANMVFLAAPGVAKAAAAAGAEALATHIGIALPTGAAAMELNTYKERIQETMKQNPQMSFWEAAHEAGKDGGYGDVLKAGLFGYHGASAKVQSEQAKVRRRQQGDRVLSDIEFRENWKNDPNQRQDFETWKAEVNAREPWIDPLNAKDWNKPGGMERGEREEFDQKLNAAKAAREAKEQQIRAEREEFERRQRESEQRQSPPGEGQTRTSYEDQQRAEQDRQSTEQQRRDAEKQQRAEAEQRQRDQESERTRAQRAKWDEELRQEQAKQTSPQEQQRRAYEGQQRAEQQRRDEEYQKAYEEQRQAYAKQRKAYDEQAKVNEEEGRRGAERTVAADAEFQTLSKAFAARLRAGGLGNIENILSQLADESVFPQNRDYFKRMWDNHDLNPKNIKARPQAQTPPQPQQAQTPPQQQAAPETKSQQVARALKQIGSPQEPPQDPGQSQSSTPPAAPQEQAQAQGWKPAVISPKELLAKKGDGPIPLGPPPEQAPAPKDAPIPLGPPPVMSTKPPAVQNAILDALNKLKSERGATPQVQAQAQGWKPAVISPKDLLQKGASNQQPPNTKIPIEPVKAEKVPDQQPPAPVIPPTAVKNENLQQEVKPVEIPRTEQQIKDKEEYDRKVAKADAERAAYIPPVVEKPAPAKPSGIADTTGTRYTNEKNELVMVGQGLGDKYMAFSKAEGKGSHRVKSKILPPRGTFAEAQADLTRYAEKKKWTKQEDKPLRSEESKQAAVDAAYADKPWAKSEPKAETPAAPVEERVSHGNKTVIDTPFGKKLDAHYAAIPAEDIISSDSPEHIKAYQPRKVVDENDKSVESSEKLIESIANEPQVDRLITNYSGAAGATTVAKVKVDGKDKYMVIAGNHRQQGVKRGYTRGTMGKYKEALAAQGSQYGVKPPSENSSLVRILDEKYTHDQLVDIAKDMNARENMAMSASEIAANDAAAVAEFAGKFKEGDLLAQKNLDFVRSVLGKIVAPTEMKEYIPDGKNELTKKGLERLKQAIFTSAYGEGPISTMSAEAINPTIKGPLDQLLRVGPGMTRAKARAKSGHAYDRDLTPAILEAAEELNKTRNRGESIAQKSLFGMSPEATEVMNIFDKHKHASKKIGDIFEEYNKLVEGYGVPRERQKDFDGKDVTKEAPPVLDILKQARSNVENKNQPTLFAKGERPEGKSLSKPEVESQVKAITAGWKNAPGIEVHENIDSLSKALGVKASPLTEGAYHNGKVHIVADAVTSPQDVERIIAHEVVGHHGMEKILGKGGLADVAEGISELRKSDPRVGKIADQVDKDYAGEDQATKDKETIARMAQEMKDPETFGAKAKLFLSRVWSRIKEFLRKLGMKFDVTMEDFGRMFHDAKKYVKGKTTLSDLAGALRGEKKSMRPEPILREKAAFSEEAKGPEFYSEMNRVLEKAWPEKSTGPKYAAMAERLVKAGRFKREEFEHSRLVERLNNEVYNRPMTKAEAMKVAEDARLKLEIPTKSGEKKMYVVSRRDGSDAQWFTTRAEANVAAEAWRDQEWSVKKDQLLGYEIKSEKDEATGEDVFYMEDYYGHNVPGSEVSTRAEAERFAEYWKERQLEKNFNSIIVERDEDGYGDGTPRYKDYTVPGEAKDYGETLLKYPPQGLSIHENSQARDRQFTEGHWSDDPGTMSHYRHDIRQNAMGEKVFFVHEFQSDLHQRGRKLGYGVRPLWKLERVEPSGQVPYDRYTETPFMDKESAQRFADELNKENQETPDFGTYNVVEHSGRVGVPDVPFKNTPEWALLTFKDALRKAAEAGVDKIAWATGKQQLEIYPGLEKHIDSVTFTKSSGGVGYPSDADTSGRLVAMNKNGEVVMDKFVSQDEIPDYIGKDPAEKLLSQDPKKTNSAGLGSLERKIVGADLKIGGEGMTAFYDKLVPDTVNAYLRKRKWGVRVEPDLIKTGDYDGYVGPEHDLASLDEISTRIHRRQMEVEPVTVKLLNNIIYEMRNKGKTFKEAVQEWAYPEVLQLFGGKLETIDRTAPVHSVEITPEMAREVLKEGQPQWSKKEAPKGKLAEALHNIKTSKGGRGGMALLPSKADVVDAGNRLLTFIQDEFRPMKEIIQKVGQGVEIPDAADAYLKIRLRPGRQAAAIDKFKNEMYTPTIEDLHRRGLSLEDAEDFIYHRGAPEVNYEMGRINPKYRNLLDPAGSGMSNSQAQNIENDLRRRGIYDNLKDWAKQFDAMTKFQREAWVRYGLMDQDSVDELERVYPNYFPKKGLAGKYETTPVGQGLNVGGRETKRAMGRNSRADNILAHLGEQIEATIIRGEKNRALQAAYLLERAYPDPARAEINKIVMKRVIDENGEVREIVDRNSKYADDVVSVKINGQEYHITYKDPRVYTALKRLDGERAGSVIKAGIAFNRLQSWLSTGGNLDFPIVNSIRDLQESLVNIGSNMSPEITKRFLKSYPRALKTAFDVVVLGKQTGNSKNIYDQWKTSGGSTGYYTQMDIEARGKEIETMLRDLDWNEKSVVDPRKIFVQSKKLIAGLSNLISRVSEASEATTRLAAFVAGRTVDPTTGNPFLTLDRAAALSRGSSVDFNMKGSAGIYVHAAYVFGNAGIQGAKKNADLLHKASKGNSKALAIIGSLIAMGFANDMMNTQLGGEDPLDKRNRWDKFDDSIKRQNFIILNPTDATAPLVTIPMFQSFNIFPVMGMNISAVLRGAKTPTQAMTSVLTALLTIYNPPGGGSADPVESLTPTSLKWAWEIKANQNWAGNPIKKSQMPGETPRPDSETHWRGTNPQFVSLAKTLNRLGGGDEFTGGSIAGVSTDISPDILQHIADYFTGGAGKFVRRSLTTATKLLNGETVAYADVPILHRLIQEPKFSDERYTQQTFYNNTKEIGQKKDRWEYLKGKDINSRMYNVSKELSDTQEDENLVDEGRLLTVEGTDQGVIVLSELADKLKKVLSAARKKEDSLRAESDPESREKADEIKDHRIELEKRFNAEADSARENTFDPENKKLIEDMMSLMIRNGEAVKQKPQDKSRLKSALRNLRLGVPAQ